MQRFHRARARARLVGAAGLAILIGTSLAATAIAEAATGSATTASPAGVQPLACSPTSGNINYSQPGNNTIDYYKPADGCAQPWISYTSRNASMYTWVHYGGSYHNVQSTPCGGGAYPCNLDNNWATDCGGGSCNSPNYFHLQWGDPVTGVTLTQTLNY